MNNENKNLNENIIDDEISFLEVARFFLRNKSIILSFTLIGTIFGLFYGFSQKKFWEGSFQIVVQDEETSATSNRIPDFLLRDNSDSNIKTEIEILKSQSVLDPVFDFVKSTKNKNGEDTSKFKYSSWVKNIKIEQIKGTNVLDISYEYTDKDNIIKTLNFISKNYQLYSGKEKQNTLEKGIKYLKKEIKRAKLNSDNSLNELQEFSMSNNLGNIDGLPIQKNTSFSYNKRNDIPEIQIKNNNKSNLNTQRFSSNFARLAELEFQLIEKSTYFTPDSIIIINLKNAIKNLEESLTRPKEILLKYRELNRNSERNENILIGLEDNLSELKLQQAREPNPWKIISNITLLEYPIRPNKKMILFASTIVMFSIISILSLIKESLEGKIYSLSYLKKQIPFKLLKVLPFKSKESWENSIALIASSFNNISKSDEIGLISIGDSPIPEIDKISQIFEGQLNEKKIITTNKITKSKNILQNQILIIYPGLVTQNQLTLFLEELNLQSDSVIGWIFIDPYIEI